MRYLTYVYYLLCYIYITTYDNIVANDWCVFHDPLMDYILIRAHKMPHRKQKLPNITHLLSRIYFFFPSEIYITLNQKQPSDAETVSAFKL